MTVGFVYWFSGLLEECCWRQTFDERLSATPQAFCDRRIFDRRFYGRWEKPGHRCVWTPILWTRCETPEITGRIEADSDQPVLAAGLQRQAAGNLGGDTSSSRKVVHSNLCPRLERLTKADATA